MNKKISFFLMNKKGFHVLSEFIKVYSPAFIEYVVGSCDEAVENDYNQEIRDLCSRYQLPYYDKEASYSSSVDYSFVIGWRWLINKPTNLIVFHDSLLPKYRGFNPLVTCLIQGEEKIGVTALFAGEKYDSGDIIRQVEVGIEYPIKVRAAIDKISELYFDLVKSITDSILTGAKINAYPQESSKATYSLWRDELDYKIDWTQDANFIKRFIDAVGYPYKGAYSLLEGKKIRIFDADVSSDVKIENRIPGKLIFFEDGCPVVVCGSGLLKLKIVTDELKNTILPLDRFRLRFN